MRIRQIALVAADLEPVLGELCGVFAIDVGFRDPGVGVFGLRNGVMPLGEQFLEVVSPSTEDTSAGRYLQRRGGDGGYMVIFQTRDLEARRKHFSNHAVRTAWEIAFEDIATIHLHPRDTGGAIVSVDEARPWESWRWAGPAWRDHVRTSRVRGIAGVEIQSENAQALCERWAAVFELSRDEGQARSEPQVHGKGQARSKGQARLTLEDGGWIEFCQARDGRGEGIRSIALLCTDAAAVREAAAARRIDVADDGSMRIAGTRLVLTD